MPSRRQFLLAAAATAVPLPAPASPGGARLGTARTLAVTVSGGARYGLRQYPQTLPLADGEVVLTFDDGPLPATTPRVLDALAAEDVRATFFLIGRNAAAYPAIVQRIARDGHSLGNHTQTHPWTMRNISFAAGLANIETGAASIRQALGGAGRLEPFMRFPGFADTPELLDAMAARNIAVFGADLWASDWNPMSPVQQLQLVLHRLERQRRGIVLFHDTKAQTAAMIPPFLAALRERGFRVVHTIGASGGT